LLVCGGAQAGRPLEVDDADPADAGQVEVEAGVAYARDPDLRRWEYPFGLAYGLAHGMEAGIGFGGQWEKRMAVTEESASGRRHESGVGDLEVGAKWQFWEACPLGARHALAAGIKFPTADDDKELGSGETDYDLTWIVSRAIGERAGAHINIGHAWVGGPDRDVWHGGLALDYQLTAAVQWVGEASAERERADGADATGQYQTGFRWNPAAGVTLDFAAGSRIGPDGPDFTATAGMTWSFE